MMHNLNARTHPRQSCRRTHTPAVANTYRSGHSTQTRRKFRTRGRIRDSPALGHILLRWRIYTGAVTRHTHDAQFELADASATILR
eukprot:1075640-Prorocentrum_minimum.AAC.1